MVADEGMNGGEILKTSHAAESLHGQFSSSKRQVRILRPIIQPAASFLLVGIADRGWRLDVERQPSSRSFQRRT
jgi:hypothetical protein